MLSNGHDRPRRFYTVDLTDGARYALYLGELVGKPSEFEPDKWYVWRYPRVWDLAPGEAYDTAEEAERAVRTQHGALAVASRGRNLP